MEEQYDVESETVYYNQREFSPYDSLSKEPEFLETEGDTDDYASPDALDYEVPDQSSETAPKLPEREPVRPSSHPPALPRKNCNGTLCCTAALEDCHATLVRESDAVEVEKKQKITLCKLYTTLTHPHIPSVYSTPSHSMEFKIKANAAISDSSLDIVNLESSGTTTPPPSPLHHEKVSLSLPRPYRQNTRAKLAVSVFLVAAIAVAVISLAVSIVAVFVVTDSGREGSNGVVEAADQEVSCNTSEAAVVMMENITSLQVEIQQLQRAVKQQQARNETNGTLDLSSFYQSCQLETASKRCIGDQTEEGLSCPTDSLPLDKEV